MEVDGLFMRPFSIYNGLGSIRERKVEKYKMKKIRNRAYRLNRKGKNMKDVRNVLPMGSARVGMQQPFDIAEAVPKKCDKCQGEFFDKVLRLGVISKIAPGNKTGQDVRIEFNTYLCRHCGHEFGAPVIPAM
jgi:hypothetical protein